MPKIGCTSTPSFKKQISQTKPAVSCCTTEMMNYMPKMWQNNTGEKLAHNAYSDNTMTMIDYLRCEVNMPLFDTNIEYPLNACSVHKHFDSCIALISWYNRHYWNWKWNLWKRKM